MFLRFKDQVDKLRYSTIELQDKLYEFQESKPFTSDNIEANTEVLKDFLPDEIVNELREINELLHKKDREYKYYLMQYYLDIYCQLTIKHEQLIKEMDY